MKKIFNFIFILIIFGLAIIIWNWQRNTYSKEDLKLEILGPPEANLLEEVEYIIKYKNNGKFRLEEPVLVFIPPENSLKEDKIFERAVFTQEQLGEAIYPGEEKAISFKIKLLGKEGEIKRATATLSYRPKNLKAKYESSTSFTTVLKSPYLTFEFDLPSRIPSGQQFILRINYFSNLDYPLADLRCQVEYPVGFEFIDSIPKSLENTDWQIPLLNKFQGGRIEISGKLSGEVGKAQIFKAKLGILKEGKFILLKETTKGVEIVKPSIFLRQEINSSPEYVAMPGDWLHYEIYFKNIGDKDLENLTLISKLEGEAFDLETIKSELGVSHPGDNTIIFEWKKIPKLQYLPPMAEGKVDFWVKLKEDLGQMKEPILRNKVFVGEAKEEFITKISTKLELVQKGYFHDDIFGNSGPLPPVVGQKTTYTILWQVKNYYSDVKDVKVKAKLPPTVELTGKIFPEEQISKFAFDSNSREIVWTVGDIERGSGILKPGQTIAFQIAFLPGESEKGKAPEIISQVRIEGLDAWTGAYLKNEIKSLTTILSDDPNFTEEMGIVQ